MALIPGLCTIPGVPVPARRPHAPAQPDHRCFNLFGHEAGPLTAEDAAIAQAFADVATITLLQERAARESALINEQLQRALSSRILIEQAKGVIAQTSKVDMNAAFALLRGYARAHNQTIYETADKMVNRRISI